MIRSHEKSGRFSETHGRCYSPGWFSWQNMKSRCQNPNHTSYKHYGARGITVCERWQEFEKFLADMGERPAGKSLDRIDNNGPYSQDNCRWATRQQQQRNRSNNKLTLDDAIAIVVEVNSGLSKRAVAVLHNIGESTVRKIVRGQIWRDASQALRSRRKI